MLMRILKPFCLLACVMSVIAVFRARDRFDVVWGGIGIIVWPIALYGIHKRVPVTWKLGFAWIAFGSLAFLSRSLSLVGLPGNLDRRIFVPFVVVSTIIVTVYWGRWWYRQKGYFFPAQ